MDKLLNAHKNGEVLGLKGVAGVVPRLDIDKFFLEYPDTANLFTLAVIHLQKSSGSDVMGWFQLSGIHGLPKAYWDNVKPDTKSKDPGNTDLSGYCAHSVNTFPTWHRPYLALFEQSLYVNMLAIAESFPTDAHKKTYRDAATKFRLPYWDYYRPRGYNAQFPGIFDGGVTSFPYDFYVPKIFTETMVMLKTPERPDSLQPVENPFRTFLWNAKTGQIPDKDWELYDYDPRFSLKGFTRTQTLRYPKLPNAPANYDPVATLNAAINKAREDNTTLSLQLMGDKLYKLYENFASNNANNKGYGSLESIHGLYHVTTGGTLGHMSKVPVSGFDPLFWFHHCQIDRWFAIWQGINPNSWFGTDKGVEKPLYPFRVSKANATWWDSNSSRSTNDFGYTYPDLVGDPAAVLQAFREHYNWSVRPPGRPYYTQPPEDMEPLPMENAQIFQYTAGNGPVDLLPNPQEFMSKATAEVMAPSHLAQEVTVELIGNPHPNGTAVTNGTNPSGEVHANAVQHSLSDLQQDGLAMPATREIDEEKYYREWYVDDVVERHALGGDFTIYYFVGPAPPADTNEHYAVYPTLAGISHNFAAPAEVCDNCGLLAEQAIKVSSTAPITSMLRDYISVGSLEDLTAPSVMPFLVKNLKWRIVAADGSVRDPRDIHSLQIGVSSRLTPKDGGDVEYQEFPEIITEIIENAS